MPRPHTRLQREARTIEAMIRIYCRAHHAGAARSEGHTLCTSCTDLLEYARRRLALCPYQETKPTCAKCPIHCYQTGRRDEIKAVMRYAGPRMMLRHPYLALRHLLDRAQRPVPKKLSKTESRHRIRHE